MQFCGKLNHRRRSAGTPSFIRRRISSSLLSYFKLSFIYAPSEGLRWPSRQPGTEGSCQWSQGLWKLYGRAPFGFYPLVSLTVCRVPCLRGSFRLGLYLPSTWTWSQRPKRRLACRSRWDRGMRLDRSIRKYHPLHRFHPPRLQASIHTGYRSNHDLFWCYPTLNQQAAIGYPDCGPN